MKFSSLAILKIVRTTTVRATSDENSIKRQHFSFSEVLSLLLLYFMHNHVILDCVTICSCSDHAFIYRVYVMLFQQFHKQNSTWLVIWCQRMTDPEPRKYHWQIDGILPKGPHPPCLRMAVRALLAGYSWNKEYKWLINAELKTPNCAIVFLKKQQQYLLKLCWLKHIFLHICDEA